MNIRIHQHCQVALLPYLLVAVQLLSIKTVRRRPTHWGCDEQNRERLVPLVCTHFL